MGALCFVAGCMSPPVETTHDSVTVPPGFDIEGCADVRGPTMPDAGIAAARECGACCLQSGHVDSSFILDNACVCANLPRIDTDHVVCDHTVSNSECAQCCDVSGFADSDGEIGSCFCLGRSDESSCSDVFGYDDPMAACAACCVEAGYLGMEFGSGHLRNVCACTR